MDSPEIRIGRPGHRPDEIRIGPSIRFPESASGSTVERPEEDGRARVPFREEPPALGAARRAVSPSLKKRHQWIAHMVFLLADMVGLYLLLK